MANWSQLPHDVLGHLTSFLPIQDHHRFGAVCRNWGVVAKQKRHSPAQQIPWLALGEDKDSKKQKFYNLVEDRHYYLDVPELRGKVICGSSYGWLFTLDRKLNCYLVNPLTREFHKLPSPPLDLEGIINRYRMDVKTYLEGEFDEDVLYTPKNYNMNEILEELQHTGVHKAILDYDPSKRTDFTAVILFGHDLKIAFWKPGNDDWTVITDLTDKLCDIALFEGKFYAVRSRYWERYCFYKFEVGPDPNVTKLEPRVWSHCNRHIAWGQYHEVGSCYLVALSGKLFLVEKCVNKFKELTTKFVVNKLDLKSGLSFGCCDIAGCSIFLGAGLSVVVKPNQFLKCRKNAIYFTLDPEFHGSQDLVIYDLVGNNKVSYVPSSKPVSPIWFTPNP